MGAGGSRVSLKEDIQHPPVDQLRLAVDPGTGRGEAGKGRFNIPLLERFFCYERRDEHDFSETGQECSTGRRPDGQR